MLTIHLTALFGIVLSICCYLGSSVQQEHKNTKTFVIIIFFSALLLRLIAAGRFSGFNADISCFAAWAERMYSVGASGFYSQEVFTDYPPGYMYVLYLVGALRAGLNISYYSAPHLILLKLPAMICDLLCSCLLYREASKRYSQLQAIFLCSAYLFNPVIILNSAVWGQVDSVFTLAVVLMCLSLIEKRTFPACLSFFAGLLIKPQMLLFAPVLFWGLLDQVLGETFNLRRLGKNLCSAIISAGMFACLCAPFGLENVWNRYFSTVESYPYAAVNACNLWGLMGLNWVHQDNTFLGITYKLYGYIFIALIIVIISAISVHHRKVREKYPFLAAILVITLFTFSVRMHERYLYPGLILLLFAFIYRPVRTVWFCYGAFSLLHFYNTAFVLFFYDPENYDRKTPLLLLVSAGMMLTVLLLHFFATRHYFADDQAEHVLRISQVRGRHQMEMKSANTAEASLTVRTRYVPCPSKKVQPLKKADLFWMVAITLVYSCFALHDLGDTTAPQSRFDMTYGDSVTLSFDNMLSNQNIHTLAYYIAPEHNRHFTIVSEDRAAAGSIYTDDSHALDRSLASDHYTSEITLENVFTWQEISMESCGDSIRLTLTDNSASLLELVFLDGDGNVVTPSNAYDYPALFDEQELYPARSSFRNSMYFDEIYHGRTAYEFLNGMITYETTHPPLGKIFISLGVALFGMTPFGWRIVGTVLGILMVPIVYLFGKRLTESTAAAALACVLFSFDFMHFTQTRIATIDVYITFFVILMYFFMYRYCQMSFYDTPLIKTFLPLGACGVCMGLGIACKWTGIYAGAGLAVLFFATLCRRYGEYRFAKTVPQGESYGISHSRILKTFASNTKNTIGFCMVFFVMIPALIYLLSYLPFVNYSSEGLFARMLHNQTAMYNYHSNLTASHPYSSSWYEWPVIKRPVWYYSSIVTGEYGMGGTREGISAFGNPLVWWIGIPAAFYTFYLWAKKKDRTAAFLLIGYLAQYLPWFFVTRITFIYHYFPSVVFVVLMIVHSLLQAKRQLYENRLPAQGFLVPAVLYGAAVFALFLLFYPVLSGQPVEASFVDKWLRWFNSWVLTAV